MLLRGLFTYRTEHHDVVMLATHINTSVYLLSYHILMCLCIAICAGELQNPWSTIVLYCIVSYRYERRSQEFNITIRNPLACPYTGFWATLLEPLSYLLGLHRVSSDLAPMPGWKKVPLIRHSRHSAKSALLQIAMNE